MQQLSIKLIEKSLVAEGTNKYAFNKPHAFTFTAGQYVIIEPEKKPTTDDRQSFRTFTISSAPHEDHLAFIMRGGESAFKQNVEALEVGDAVTIKGPLGHMQLPSDASVPAVFLCAGVGITPARSMLLDAAHRQSSREFVLINSNREVCSTPCLDEMLHLKLENYLVVNVMAKECEKWQSENGKKWGDSSSDVSREEIGRVDTQLIHKYVSGLIDPTYYIIGTTGYVKAMQACLDELKVSKEKIIIDNFG